MTDTSLAAVPRLFDNLSDAEIVGMAIPEGELLVRLSTETVRYVGSRKLPPGPPFSLTKENDGTYNLDRVAIVRVHPEDHIHKAKKMIRHAVLKSLLIGLLCGGVAAGGAVWYVIHQERARAESSVPVTPPCLVNSISGKSVGCQIGPQSTQVAVGQFFPDGRYQLQAVSDSRRSFTARRITDSRLVVFQLVSNQSIQPEGNSK